MTTIGARNTVTTMYSDREFWRGVLEDGAFTALPRWTSAPMPGAGEYEARIPDDLMAASGALAEELAVPLRAVLLAAHGKVLAALSGEREVTTGYVPVRGGETLPCRLTTEPESWRGLVTEAHRAELELLAHKDFPVAELRGELNVTEQQPEVVFDPVAQGAGELGDDTVLRAGIEHRGGFVLRLRYRRDVLDGDCAARLAGYHLTALRLMAADPATEHRRQSLLSAHELRFQIDGLAGRQRELPNRRVHELVEDRARAHPDAVAAVYREREWTYRELNLHANRLARALLARGLRREGVVAVVAERNLDWMAAVLAIFKAGGVYLPIEPQFPAHRIARMLSRAGCRLVLTEPGSTETLTQALTSLSGVEGVFIEGAYEEEHSAVDLGTPVAPDQLAYILFTSGSTGEPKGAMCEHAGMLNHMYAKIDDLRIGEGQVVAQNGPQCFDVSIWQLFAALLVDGRTLLVEREAIMDPRRFLDRIVGGRVNVLQVVPSYLEVLLSHLEQHPRELPDLRYLSVTGEAVKKELTQRWFAAQPTIGLMNAYGLSETSDDTNHEMMDGVPDGARVPLGRPVNNVHAYVVDRYLLPVPLGAPGEIVFSGVCVGRGYINDPARTRRVFTADPHREGHRLYRSGDVGRWRPDGKLDYLGRRDTQVKISGFRIEIGEIENSLLQVPRVRDGAVVVRERANGSKYLLAFYSAQRPIEASLLRDRLGESLPGHMLPSAYHWRRALPLSPNGKIDRKALAALATELDGTEHEDEEPTTATELRVADAWSEVLGIPREKIGRRDHFFDIGGTSLSAVKLAIALGRAVSFSDLVAHPVLADLAALIDGASKRRFGMLRSVSKFERAPTRALVCFPYAAGNAVNFQSMASALRGSGLAVYAVELPGHDLAENEPFAPMTEVIGRVIDEIEQLGLTQVLLWGHSAGAAFALATARKLHRRAVTVERVFIGAQLLGDVGDRRAMVSELSSRSKAEIVDRLSADGGYSELGQLDGERALHVGAAYRHDCLSANRYLAFALGTAPAVRLRAPVTVVVAADDPCTAGFSERYREWQRVAEQVDVHQLADGGHYFVRTRPAEAAQAVLAAVEPLASVSSSSN